MSAPEVGAVVVGAGVAGLAAAVELQDGLSEVYLIDAGDRPGGALRTDHVAGFVVERGPNTVQVRGPLREFLRRSGLEGELVRAEPESRLRFLYRGGRLEPVPLSPLALLRTPLLSARGKLRLLAEPLVRRGDPTRESVAEFARRRLGAEAVEGLVGPFLTGIYAGDERELGAEAVFGGLVEHERRHGSIALGLARGAFGRGGARGLRGVYSARNGLGPFARRIAERLAEPPTLETQVTSLRREGEEWRVRMLGPAGARELRTRRVVVAAPAREAARLLRDTCEASAGELAAIRYAPIVSVSLGVRPAQLRAPLEGFGFLVPREAGLELLGCLFMSRLFRGRAPAGSDLLQCLLGGVRWPEAVDLPDDVLAKRLCADLERTLGLQGEPQLLAVSRWPRAVPQPDRDHVRRVARLRARVAELPGLALAGSYLDGVGVSDSLASGVRAARQLLPDRPS
jgi:oxygen-dependent protoporphyrinogen oxidase